MASRLHVRRLPVHNARNARNARSTSLVRKAQTKLSGLSPLACQ